MPFNCMKYICNNPSIVSVNEKKHVKNRADATGECQKYTGAKNKHLSDTFCKFTCVDGVCGNRQNNSSDN